MTNRPGKRSRKEALNRWKAEQRAAVRSSLPLADEQMKALFDMLDVELPRQGCDRTLRLTCAWLTVQGMPIEPVVAWLHKNGGFCDCEVLANAEEAFNQAVGSTTTEETDGGQHQV